MENKINQLQDLIGTWSEEDVYHTDEKSGVVLSELYYTTHSSKKTFQVLATALKGNVIYAQCEEVDGEYKEMMIASILKHDPDNVSIDRVKLFFSRKIREFIYNGVTSSGSLIRVSSDDVFMGIPGDSCECPIALAILRQKKDVHSVEVGGKYITIYYHNLPKVKYLLPPEAIDFIEYFDETDKGDPFNFEIGIKL